MMVVARHKFDGKKVIHENEEMLSEYEAIRETNILRNEQFLRNLFFETEFINSLNPPRNKRLLPENKEEEKGEEQEVRRSSRESIPVQKMSGVTEVPYQLQCPYPGCLYMDYKVYSIEDAIRGIKRHWESEGCVGCGAAKGAEVQMHTRTRYPNEMIR